MNLKFFKFEKISDFFAGKFKVEEKGCIESL